MTGPDPKFEVAYDRSANLLRWTMRGFWSMSDVTAFVIAMRTAVAPLGPPPQRYDGLCDSTDFPVQAGDVSAALGEIDRIASAMRQGRLAIVVGSAMNKLQAQRTLISEGVRVFRSMEEARSWLRDKPVEPA